MASAPDVTFYASVYYDGSLNVDVLLKVDVIYCVNEDEFYVTDVLRQRRLGAEYSFIRHDVI